MCRPMHHYLLQVQTGYIVDRDQKLSFLVYWGSCKNQCPRSNVKCQRSHVKCQMSTQEPFITTGKLLHHPKFVEQRWLLLNKNTEILINAVRGWASACLLPIMMVIIVCMCLLPLFFLFVLSEASFDGVSPKTDNKNSNYHFHADIEYHHPYMSFHKSRSCALSSIRLKITVKSKSPRRSHFESVTT
jgi:hypothetical protein